MLLTTLLPFKAYGDSVRRALTRLAPTDNEEEGVAVIEMISRAKERKRRDKLIVRGQEMTTVTIIWWVSVKNIQPLDSIVLVHLLTPVNVQT